ncbi:MAG: ribonuclease E/G, partial [Rhodobacteraceae bacterium]|nr:ribonuclease E/G [Paracoccaceae bacterium]
LKTNLEAADEIARQLRLRDLAGLVVIDFIDMEENRNNHAVERRLKEALKHDRARIQVGRISHFGLLELSRQRLRPSLIETNYRPCPHCGGTGHVRSTESAAIYALRMIEEEGVRRRSSELTVTVHPTVALYILNHKRAAIADMEARFGLRIFLLGDDNLVAPALRIDRVKMTRQSGEEMPAPQPQQRAVVPANDADNDVEDEESEDETESEELSAEDTGGSESDDANGEDQNEAGGRGRRSRRGRRRRRRDGQISEGQRPQDQAQSEQAIEPTGDEGESSERTADAEASSGQDGERSDEQAGQRDDRNRRRRRGRRGGRRRRREAGDDQNGQNVFGQPDDGAAAASMGPFATDTAPAENAFSAQSIDGAASEQAQLPASDAALAHSPSEPDRGGASRLFRAIRDTAFSWTRPDTPKSDVAPLPPETASVPDAITIEPNVSDEAPPPAPAVAPVTTEIPEPPSGPPRKGWWQQSS